MEAASLLPDPAALQLRLVTTENAVIVLHVETVRAEVRCPDCGTPSSRVHSHYRRTIKDLPWQGVAIRLLLFTRRFFCTNSNCARTIFTERLPNVVERYARRTDRLQLAITLLGYAQGGEAGARIAASLGLGGSPDTLLRRVREMASKSVEHAAEGDAISVVGVDDWAFRRGQRYGTILVDLERHRVVDLLPERSAECLANWLRAHPTVTIVSRDRAEMYADGARRGAPSALQIADRWHLLKNLGEAMDRLLSRHQSQIRLAARHARESLLSARSHEREEDTSPLDLLKKAVEPGVDPTQQPTRAERQLMERRELRQARWAEVRDLYRQGHSQRSIERRTGMSRKTVRKYIRADTCPYYPRTRRRRRTLITPHESFLKKRWDEGCHNAAKLFEEIKQQGFRGQYTTLRAFLRAWRVKDPGSIQQEAHERRFPWNTAAPTPREVRWWLLGHRSVSGESMQCTTHAVPADAAIMVSPEAQASRESRTKAPVALDEQRRWQDALVDELKRICPEIEEAQQLAVSFVAAVKQKSKDELRNWIALAGQSNSSEMRAFARGLQRDLDAVTAALTNEWSNGQTEGQVNRLKFIKRQMYGRANFDLLKARVLPMARSA